MTVTTSYDTGDDAGTDEATGGWVRTWAASPQSPDAALGSLDGTPPFDDVTLRQVVRATGAGRMLRVRITNEYGAGPLTIGAGRVGLAAPGGGVLPGSARPLTFDGRPGIVLPAGTASYSDPVDRHVDALSLLSVSLHLPDRVERCTCHDPAPDTGWAVPGDAVAATALPRGARPLPVRALLSAVDVRPDGPAVCVVAIGDSRTDGAGSTPDAHRSWPDRLAERLAGRGGRAVHVVNHGISGNRLLNDGIGESGLARFERDVLATPGLAHVLVSIGGNDLAVSFAPRAGGDELHDLMAMFPGDPVTGGDVIAGYRQLVDRAHRRGVAIYASTIPPYGGDEMFTPDGDRERETVNDWIRTSGTFDAVVDFDAAWRDPARPSRIRDGLHAGDHLHGSDDGYRTLADAVDPGLFD